MLITSASDNNWTSTLKYKDPVSTLGLVEFSTAVDAEVDYTDDILLNVTADYVYKTMSYSVKSESTIFDVQ